MLHYNLPAFAKGDTTGFLSGIARTSNLIRKGGVLDFSTAARPVLRDWNTGKLAIYTEPEVSKSTGQNDEVAVTLSDNDERILAKLRTRKEMWKEKGPVKLERGVTEERRIALDAEFIVEEMMEGKADSHASGYVANVNDEEEENDDEKGYESDNNEEDESEDSEDEEEDPHPISRKRKATTTNSKDLQPSKKVAFASGTADRNEKKAARKLHSQQVKDARQKAKVKTTAAQPQEKPHGNEKITIPGDDKPSLKASTKIKDKPKFTNTKPPRASLNKSSSKASSAADSNAYDFNQFFKTS